jgi:hypothetical protein
MEMAIEEVRRQRDLMLQATDHFEMIRSASSSDEEYQAWIDYRQELRNITTLDYFSVENDFWPLPPKRYKLLDGCTTINLPTDYQDRF